MLGSPFPILTSSFWDFSAEVGCQTSEPWGERVNAPPLNDRVPQLPKALGITGFRAQVYRIVLAKANLHGHYGVFCNGLQAHCCSKGRGRCSIKGGRGGLLHLSDGQAQSHLLILAPWALLLPGEEGIRGGKKKRKRVLEGICYFYIWSLLFWAESSCSSDQIAAVETTPHPGFKGPHEPDRCRLGTLIGPPRIRHFLSIVVSVRRM